MSTDTSVPANETVSPRARRVRHRHLRWDWYGRLPELFVTSERLARAITGLGAGLILVGTVLWCFQAWERLDVPDVVRPMWFRAPQFALAVVGIAVSSVEVAYLAYYTVTGTVWRRWRGVSIAFGLVSAAWTAVWLLDRFVLDATFIG